jgi:1-deoxy-D-xylulose-5-phosphate synthase
VLVHVNTVKGKGYEAAEQDAVKFHGVPPNGHRKASVITYTQAFSDALVKIARERREVVAITAAMPDGTGLVPFAREFPERLFDVGIAEQHAITFAAGMACQGLRPVVAIYSTFLQRGFDQIVHDVCLQKAPVVFAIDRAGIVGDDGRTHQGLLDIAFLRCVPDLTIMAPKDENELQRMLYTALQLDGPSALRYPRGEGLGVKLDKELRPLPVGKAEVMLAGDDLLILAVGSTVAPAVKAAMELRSRGVAAGVINARFIKPLDEALILASAKRCHRFVTVEEGTLAGGFGSAVLELLHSQNLSDVAVHCMGIPDETVEQGPQSWSRERYGLTAGGITREITTHFPELLAIAKNPA